MNILAQIFTAYIMTLVLVGGNILHLPREEFKAWTPWLKINGKHFADCRLCVGLYVSILVWFLYGINTNLFLIWGASYFLATQERM
jgi:uncharacterized iron-regulated membrane protein